MSEKKSQTKIDDFFLGERAKLRPSDALASQRVQKAIEKVLGKATTKVQKDVDVCLKVKVDSSVSANIKDASSSSKVASHLPQVTSKRPNEEDKKAEAKARAIEIYKRKKKPTKKSKKRPRIVLAQHELSEESE